MLDGVPMTDGSHKAFGTAHIPCIRVGEDFGDSCNGFTASSGRYDGSNLWRLSGTNDLMDPEHIILHEESGFLNPSFGRERKRFLCMGEIDAVSTFTC